MCKMIKKYHYLFLKKVTRKINKYIKDKSERKYKIKSGKYQREKTYKKV